MVSMLYCKYLGASSPSRTVSRIVFCLLLSCLSVTRVQAKEAPRGGSFMINHVKDAHEWHFVTMRGKHVTLPLPIIIYSPDRGLLLFSSRRFVDEQHRRVSYAGYVLDERDRIVALAPDHIFYDLSITKNVAAALVGTCVLLCIFLTAARYYRRGPRRVPRGVWALVELLVCFVRDEIAIPNLGRARYQRFTPYLLSVFFFIWVNNILGLMPGAANVTGNISVTLVLAMFTFALTNLSGDKHYWNHIFNTPGVPRWLAPIMIPIELIGLFTKPFALMLRLFANITSGHIILLSIIGLIFVLESAWVGVVSVPFGAFMFLLKLLVAFLQAYIFTLLSAIYLGEAVNKHV